MAVTVYRSTDASAPVLSGTAGALVAVLDACLRTGYGSKAGAGWSKPFTGTNAASFKQGGGNGFYLDVNDNTPAIANEAWLRGYEVETAVATGTGSFPTAAQITNGIFFRKSATADAVARVWTLIADDRTFYLFAITGDTANTWYCFGFGDFYSYLAGTDGFRTFIMGRAVTGGVTTNENADRSNTGFGVTTGHYVARSYTGLGGSVQLGKQGDSGKANAGANLLGVMALPHPVDGRVWIAPVFPTEGSAGTSVIRGKLRGFMHWLHLQSSFADQDTVTGTGPFAGRTFLLFKGTGNSAAYCIDITGPWDAN